MGSFALNYPAALYAALHRGNFGDVDYYRRQCEGCASLVELGCGYGRVLAALEGVVPERWGLDRDPGLLAMARSSTDAALVEGTMQSFELGRTFDRVLIPYNGLYCLVTDVEVQGCFTSVRRHLSAGGRLVFDVYPYEGPPSDDDLPPAEGAPVVQLQADSRWYTVTETAEYDFDTEVAAITYRYTPDDGSEAVAGTIVQRALTVPRIESLLSTAGLRVVERAGGFFGQPLDDDAEQWVLVAESANEGPPRS